MLLSEMVRRIRSERLLVDDASTYTQIYETDWVTKTEKNIVLDEDAILWFTFTLYYHGAPVSGGYIAGNARLLVDGLPVCSIGEAYLGGGGYGTLTATGFIYLSAGQHTFTYQVAVHRNTVTENNYVRLQSIQIRKMKFSDTKSYLIDSGTVTAPDATETTVINTSVVFPQRRLAVGKIKSAPVRIVVYAEGVGNRLSVLRSTGEEPTSGRLNWRLYVDDAQVSWTGRRGDNESGFTTNMAYSEGAYGYYESVFEAGRAVNVKVKVYNATGSSMNVRAVALIFINPWIIGLSEYEPVSLSFPQGSTLYMVLEPLSSDPTKTVKLGGIRAWDLGYNYYSTASGAGILSWSYTFESLEVEQSILRVGGSGGCVSIIAVDVR